MTIAVVWSLCAHALVAVKQLLMTRDGTQGAVDWPAERPLTTGHARVMTTQTKQPFFRQSAQARERWKGVGQPHTTTHTQNESNRIRSNQLTVRCFVRYRDGVDGAGAAGFGHGGFGEQMECLLCSIVCVFAEDKERTIASALCNGCVSLLYDLTSYAENDTGHFVLLA